MGATNSKEDSYRPTSSSWDSNFGYPESPPVGYPPSTSGGYPPSTSSEYPPSTYGQEGSGYNNHMEQQNYATPYYAPPAPAPQEHGGDRRRLDKKYSRFADNYNSLEEVSEALARAGLESSNLIIGIDFTKSNEWTGARSFRRKSLHHIGDGMNPYEQGISIIGKTLAAFDEDNMIPCYGFGDASTHDQDVFSFYPNDRFCQGFEEVLSRYREIVPQLRLAGPTSFAPVIEMAMTIVENSGGQYHVLVIIADGQVTRSVDTRPGQLSPQEQKTIDAIVQASKLPLSIILVGVGDGPWDTMKEFDDNIPARAFDNFQFVNFTEIMAKKTSPSRKETEFALEALMEIPSQYKATIELNILGRKGNIPERIPLPPPVRAAPSHSVSKPSRLTSYQPSQPTSYQPSVPPYPDSFQPSVPPYPRDTQSSSSFQPNAPPYHGVYEPEPVSKASNDDNQLCPICLTNPRDMAFGCGHQTCEECSRALETCPICRSAITTKIKLYI